MHGGPSSLEALAGALVAAVAGLLVGTLGTFKHHAGVSVLTGQGVPYGLVLSLAMVAVMLAALRATFATRLYAGAGGLGVVGAVALFGRPGPGGSDVVPLDVPGLVWWIGTVLIAVLVVAVPARRRSADSRRADGILETPAKEED